MTINRERLLREYVHQILEDDGGGDMGYGFGGGYVDPSDMYTVFIKPFTDVFHTAVGKTKEMSIATSELIRVSIEATLTSLIPIYSSDYNDIFNKYENQLDKVKDEYKDIYDSTWTAFTDNDIVLAAFGMYPTRMITQLAARKAPLPIIGTLDALTGGFFEKYFQKVRKILNPDEKKPLDGAGFGTVGSGGGYGLGGYGAGGDYGGGFDGGGFGESVLREKKKPKNKNQKKKKDFVSLILNPKILSAVEKNPRVQQMMNDSRNIFRETLEDLFDRVQKVTSVNDLQQLQQVVKKPIKGLDKISQLPNDQQQKISQQVMKNVKSAISNVYVKNLTNQIKDAVAAGVPKNHPMISDLTKTIKKIKSL